METDEPPFGFLPSCNLLDSCSSGRMGRALALGTQTQSSILIHHCQSNDCGPDLISLKCGERDYPDGYDCSEKDVLSLCSFPGFNSEKSQNECSQPSQTCDLGSNWPAERRALSHLYFGVSAHRALPTTLHGCRLWQTQGDPEGYGASLALCPPASGKPDAKASPRNLTSSAGRP